MSFFVVQRHIEKQIQIQTCSDSQKHLHVNVMVSKVCSTLSLNDSLTHVSRFHCWLETIVADIVCLKRAKLG